MYTLDNLLCASLRRATEVLYLVKVADGHKDRVYVKAFANGREQGYHVRVSLPQSLESCLNLWFAESRNSDEMVVYVDNGYIDEPTDDGWKNRKFFLTTDALAKEITERIRAYFTEKAVPCLTK